MIEFIKMIGSTAFVLGCMGLLFEILTFLMYQENIARIRRKAGERAASGACLPAGILFTLSIVSLAFSEKISWPEFFLFLALISLTRLVHFRIERFFLEKLNGKDWNPPE